MSPHERDRWLGVGRAGGVESMKAGRTAAEAALRGPGDGGVVVAALGGQGFAATVGSGEGAAERLGEAGAEAAACAGELNGGHERKVLIVLTDGLAGDQQEIVRGAYAAVGAGVPLVGGCAGDGLDVVAEGIESTTQRNQLIDLGCEMGQGLHLSPPLPVEEADALLLGAGLLPPPREPGSEDVAHEHEGDTAREDAPQ